MPLPTTDTISDRNLQSTTPISAIAQILPQAFQVLLKARQHLCLPQTTHASSQKPNTLLPSALQDLLKGISTRADVHVGNWAFHLADKLRRAWFPLAGSPPFAAHRGEEALEYAALPTLDR